MLALAFVTLVVSESYVKHQVPVLVSRLQVFVDLWDKGYVALEGTWVMDGEEQAFPLNQSKIVCRAESQTCEEAIARISNYGIDARLEADLERYEITSWDGNTLIYRTGAKCVDYVYTVSRDTKQVSGIRTIKHGLESECSDLTKEIKLRLADGIDVWNQMQRDTEPVAVEVTAFLLILFWGAVRIRRIVKA